MEECETDRVASGGLTVTVLVTTELTSFVRVPSLLFFKLRVSDKMFLKSPLSFNFL